MEADNTQGEWGARSTLRSKCLKRQRTQRLLGIGHILRGRKIKPEIAIPPAISVFRSSLMVNGPHGFSASRIKPGIKFIEQRF